jgi:hypothetical protein
MRDYRPGGRNGKQWIQVANDSQDVTVSLHTEPGESQWHDSLEYFGSNAASGVRGPMVQGQMSACRTTQSNG